MPLGPDGKYVRSLAPKPKATAAPEPQGLDLEGITKTVSSIKKWLKTEPSQSDAMEAFQYELDNSNRSSAVGSEGCLTEYLEK